MKNKEVKGIKGVQEVQGVKEVKEVQGVLSPLRSESVASRRAQGVQDITLEDIIDAARELHDEENAQISAKDLDQLIGHTSTHRPAMRPRWWAAACLLGFLAGFGVKSALPSSNSIAVVPSTESTLSAVPSSPPDTILLREVVHDTVYQTRVIVCDAEPKAIKTVVAQNEQKPEPVETTPSVGCSMLCDDIPYAYLAHN